MTAPDSDRHPAEHLLPEVEAELCEALRCAHHPAVLRASINDALIAAALEDPLAPPSEAEVVESRRLRDALEGHGDHADAELARALRLAKAPTPIDPALGRRLASPATRRTDRSRVIQVAFGAAASIAALAAAIALSLRPADHPDPDLVPSRTAAALFTEKFETAKTTARIDRIAAVRARELRDNRYASWGIR